MFGLIALVIGTVVTTPVQVGIRVPDSVTIAMPSSITLPTPAPQPTYGANPAAASPNPGSSPAPSASPGVSATQAMANEIADQITKQLAESMGASQTKPLVSVQWVQIGPSSPFSTPSPSAGGDYVATIDF